MKKITNFFLALNLFLFIAIFNISTAKSDEVNDFFNADIFSLAKKKENAFDASSSVYVLSSEDIRRSGVTSIPEALRMVPGIQVARQAGNTWAISARGLNHQYASKLLVMIDGVSVYTPSFSGVLWDNQDYVLEDIDRIEVIRGPGGSIWGANAVNGIINIITKSSAQTQGAYISQIVGNNDNSITEARYGGKLKNGLDTYRVYAKHVNRDGFPRSNNGRTNVDTSVNNRGSRSNNDGMVNSRAGFKYDIASIKDNSISIHGDVVQGESKNYLQNIGDTAGVDAQTDKDNTNVNLVVNWNKVVSRKSNFSLQSYYNYDRNDIQVIDFTEKTFDVDFQHFYDFSEKNKFIWGLGYRNIQDKIESFSIGSGASSYVPIEYSPDTRNIETYSAFLQDKIGIVVDKLYLTIGTKFEHNDQTGTEYQPNARLTYFPSRNQTLWAAVSRAIRTPTRGEDSFEVRVAPGTTVAKGSPTSLAETVTSYELGYRIKPTYKTLIDISTYFNEYSRLGNFDADTSGGNPGVPTASNSGRATTFGGELTGKWQATNDLRFEVGYDFLKTDIKLNGASNENDNSASLLNADRLAYFENMSPRNQFRIRGFYNVTPKIEFDNMVYYVDYLKAREAPGTDEGDVPSYIRWDTRIGYLFNRHFEGSFGIQNILDDRHNEFGQGFFNNRIEVGRTYYVKAVVQF